MLDVYRKLYDLLDRQERRRVWLLFAMTIVMAFLEMAGVASIMPFVAVLSRPELTETNVYLAAAYEWLGFESTNSFLVFLGFVFFFVLVGSLSFKALTFWAQVRFTHMRVHFLGCRLVARYLGQPYQWFLNRPSSGIASTVLAEVNKAINGALFPAIQLVAQLLVIVFLMALLIVIDPLLAMMVGAALGGAYACVYLCVRNYLGTIGEKRRVANRARFAIVQEAFGGIKDVKIAGLEHAFLQRFEAPSARVARYGVTAKVIGEMPSFFMQAVVFGGMVLVVLYLMLVHGNLQDALPVLAAYVFAGYRLMPALQNGFRQLSEMRYSSAVLDALQRDLRSLDPVAPAASASHGPATCAPGLPLREMLELRDVVYQYPGSEQPALDGLTLQIPARTTVGVVGSTGSGKTTAVDLILGLLRPVRGELHIDGTAIDDASVRSWQRNVGYVPQHVFLSDDTIARNIAFGIAAERIDRAAVERAARVANLHDFVINELPDGYDTKVGERGVRLSGGQRQRIGIARALYHDPDVLLLDEATSSLDNVTERAVMKAVHELGRRKTIIIIAHRLSTVRNCDRIYMLEKGCCVAEGAYEELLSRNGQFQAMARGAV